MNIEIKSSFQQLPRFEKIGALILTFIAPLIIICIGFLVSSNVQTDKTFIIISAIVFAAIPPVIAIPGYFKTIRVTITNNEVIWKGMLTKKITFQDLVGVYSSRHKGKLIVFVASKDDYLGIGYEFIEEEVKKILSRLKEIAISNQIEYKENLTMDEINQIFEEVYLQEP